MTATTSSTGTAVATPVRPVSVSRRRRPVRMGAVVTYAVLALLALIYIYPFLIDLATSFKTDKDATADPLGLIPPTWTSAAYANLFFNSDFPRWFLNSGIVMSTAAASLSGYCVPWLS